MNDEWYYTSGGKEYGPVTRGILVELGQSGVLLPTDRIRSGTDGWWIPPPASFFLASTLPADLTRTSDIHNLAQQTSASGDVSADTPGPLPLSEFGVSWNTIAVVIGLISFVLVWPMRVFVLDPMGWPSYKEEDYGWLISKSSGISYYLLTYVTLFIIVFAVASSIRFVSNLNSRVTTQRRKRDFESSKSTAVDRLREDSREPSSQDADLKQQAALFLAHANWIPVTIIRLQTMSIPADAAPRDFLILDTGKSIWAVLHPKNGIFAPGGSWVKMTDQNIVARLIDQSGQECQVEAITQRKLL